MVLNNQAFATSLFNLVSTDRIDLKKKRSVEVSNLGAKIIEIAKPISRKFTQSDRLTKDGRDVQIEEM
jgi:hypothetical protein